MSADNITRFGFLPKSSGVPASKRMGGFILDMSEVQARMNELNHVILPARIRRGLELAGKRLMDDTMATRPTTPIHRPDYPSTESKRAGELRASGAVFVDGVKKADSLKYGETATGKYQPQVYGGTPIDKTSHEACVVFNAPYAAKQHEDFPIKTEPTAGTNYMGKHLYANAPEYIAIVAKAIRL